MRPLLGITGLAIIALGCYTGASNAPRIAVTIENGHADPVDVRFYCGMSRTGSERWVTLGEVRKVRVRAGVTCDLRVVVRPSIEGGRFTRSQYYDSGSSLFAAHDCESLIIRPGTMLSATYTMPRGC